MAIQENRGKLMWASFLTLIAAGMGFGVRAGTLAEWSGQFGFTQGQLGTITGGGLTGFGVVILLASVITDRIGYKTILLGAFLLHILSVVITLAATPVYAAAGQDAAYWCLFIGIFIFAIANGLCEAVINPLIANIYPERKTHYLNILHAGWPGGLILGGFVGLFFLGPNAMAFSLRWEIVLATYLLPAIWYGYIVLTEPFPDSDVKKAGVSFGAMLAEFAAPVLLFLLVLHACVGFVELGTDSWIVNITETFTEQGFMLFIYTSALMFILRFFAGPIVERINPLGLLCVSTVLGTTGLLFLGSIPSSMAWMAWLAVTVYGLGKTFLWPTMLGIVGERFPKGGALTMGAIGGVGMLSAGLLGGPIIGYMQDTNRAGKLAELDEPAYERYQVEEATSPYAFLPKVKGLNGAKVSIVNDNAKVLTADIKKLEEQNSVVPTEMSDLKSWWDTEGMPNAATDKPNIKTAEIYGGQRALVLTAAVPAFMFFGYLILVLYFRSQGGYKVVELDSSGKTHETNISPSAEDAIEAGEEGPTSGQA
jgi:MFS family permease